MDGRPGQFPRRSFGCAGNLIRPGNLSSERFVGFQPGLVMHTFSPHFSSTAGYLDRMDRQSTVEQQK